MDEPRDRLSVEELMRRIEASPHWTSYALACHECGSTSLTFPEHEMVIRRVPYGVTEDGRLLEASRFKIPPPPVCNECGNVGASMQRQER